MVWGFIYAWFKFFLQQLISDIVWMQMKSLLTILRKLLEVAVKWEKTSLARLLAGWLAGLLPCLLPAFLACLLSGLLACGNPGERLLACLLAGWLAGWLSGLLNGYKLGWEKNPGEKGKKSRNDSPKHWLLFSSSDQLRPAPRYSKSDRGQKTYRCKGQRELHRTATVSRCTTRCITRIYYN